MIVGRGLMARSFQAPMTQSEAIVVHAAGVSNSRCCDEREFGREAVSLASTLKMAAAADCLVYFSTCSIADPEAAGSPYVRHKLAMEALARAHPRHLILRLPQVAGFTPNPHTLLNFLHARIARGERFAVWRHARRNIIDSEDVRRLGLAAIGAGVRGDTLDIACTRDHSMVDIVRAIEDASKGHAVYDLVDKGSAYHIDTARTRGLMRSCGVEFGPDYLERVVAKYYSHRGLAT
jgi:nucleoside-diphosphate-sugar epimerase